MITLEEVLEALEELEDAPHNWDTTQKLAALLVLRDKLGGDAEPRESLPVLPPADSEFLRLALAKDPAAVWRLMDEMMEAAAVLLPRMYDSVLRRLREM